MARQSQFKPEYCEMLVDHMAKGFSFESFAGVVKTSMQTLRVWTQKHPEFEQAKDEGMARCRLFWEKIGIGGALGQIENFNATSFIFNMKNRWGWRDRVEIEGQLDHVHEHRHSVDLAKLTRELKQILMKPNADAEIPEIVEVRPARLPGRNS